MCFNTSYFPQIKYQACPDIQGSESKGKRGWNYFNSIVSVYSGANDLRCQVEGGKQEILCGPCHIETEQMGRAEGSLSMLPL